MPPCKMMIATRNGAGKCGYIDIRDLTISLLQNRLKYLNGNDQGESSHFCMRGVCT